MKLIGLSLFLGLWSDERCAAEGTQCSSLASVCVWELVHTPAPLFTVTSLIFAHKHEKLWRLTWI